MPFEERTARLIEAASIAAAEGDFGPVNALLTAVPTSTPLWQIKGAFCTAKAWLSKEDYTAQVDSVVQARSYSEEIIVLLAATDLIPGRTADRSALTRIAESSSLADHAAQAIHSLGVLAYDQGDMVGAAAHFEAAVRRGEHGYPNASNNLGVIVLDRGDISGAAAHFEAAVGAGERRGEHGHPGASHNLGVLARDRGDTSGAVAHFEAAVRAGERRGEHGYPNASYNLGQIRLHLLTPHYDPTQARSDLQRASKDNGGVHVLAHLLLAHYLLATEPSSARRLAFEALTYAPTSTVSVSFVQQHFATAETQRIYASRLNFLLRDRSGEQAGESLTSAETDGAGLHRIERLLTRLERHANSNVGRLLRLLALLPHTTEQSTRLRYLLPYVTQDYASAYLVLEGEFEDSYALSLRDHFAYLDLAARLGEPKGVLQANLQAAQAEARRLGAPEAWQRLRIEPVANGDPYLHKFVGLDAQELFVNSDGPRQPFLTTPNLDSRLSLDKHLSLDKLTQVLPRIEALAWACHESGRSLDFLLSVDAAAAYRVILQHISAHVARSAVGEVIRPERAQAAADALVIPLTKPPIGDETTAQHVARIAIRVRNGMASRITYRATFAQLMIGEHTSITDVDHAALLAYAIYLLHYYAHAAPEVGEDVTEGLLGSGLDWVSPNDALAGLFAFLPIPGIAVVAKVLLGVVAKRTAKRIWESVREGRVLSWEDFREHGYPPVQENAELLRRAVRVALG